MGLVMSPWSLLKSKTKLFTNLLFGLLISLWLTIPQNVAAQVREFDRTQGEVFIKEYGDTTVQVASIKGIEVIISNILAVFTTIVGLAAFVMLLMGGFLYLTSGSNSKGTEAAKQTITYSIIGIVVALMAFFILQAIAAFTGAEGILEFNLGLGTP